jgi:hypothetical protein
MRNTPVDYNLIPRGTDDFVRMQKFAESFDHQIADNPNINVYALARGDHVFGYSEHVFLPVVYPAFHPSLTRPQDVLQVMRDWRAHAMLSGRMGYIGVPLPEESGRANFPETTMKKLGLQRMRREIFQVIPTGGE